MIWTGDHLDAVRRLERILVQSALVATDRTPGRSPRRVLAEAR
jgi:hypothetical protein